MPHGSGTALSLDRPERSRPKRHIEFDKRRLEPDPDFIDERTKPYKPKKSTGLLNGLKALFGGCPESGASVLQIHTSHKIDLL